MTDQKSNNEILNSRQATYGDRQKNMAAAAKMVNGYLDAIEVRTGKRELEAVDFPALMALYKMYRFGVTPDYSDNVNDVEGYMEMAREIVGDDMIDAPTAEEYQRLKKARSAMSHLTPAQRIMWADAAEACTMCFRKDCTGDCKDDLVKRERAYNQTIEQDKDEEIARLKKQVSVLEWAYEQDARR